MIPTRCNILYLAPGYPFAEMPSESTFYHRRAKQLSLTGAHVSVFCIRALTPASYLIYPYKVWNYWKYPQSFSYMWEGINVACEKIHFYWAGSKSTAIQHQRRKLYEVFKRRFGACLRKGQYDVIIFAGGSLSFGLAAADLAHEFSVPLISFVTGDDINDVWDKVGTEKYEMRKKQLLSNRKILAVSNDLKRKIDIMTQNTNLAVTFYSGVDVGNIHPDEMVKTRMRNIYNIGENEYIILFVGHLLPAKGIYELIEVCRQLKDYDINYRCFLVGRGEKQHIKRLTTLIRQYNLKERIEVIGGVPHERVIEFLKMADLFIFPSWAEGMPNAVLEAAAAALPIVASNVGGISEIISGVHDGRLVPIHQIQPLVNAVLDGLTHRDVARIWGIQARKNVMARFNYQLSVGHLRSLLCQFVDNNN